MLKFIVIFIFPQLLWAQNILFLGDSLTEGYGVPKKDSYPQLLQEKLKKEYPKWKVRNASISGSTSASCSKRLKWQLKSKPAIIFIALGANDGLRGIKPSVTKKNLKKCIQLALNTGISSKQIVLAGIKMAYNYGKEYRSAFDKVYPELAKELKLSFIAFLLDKVAAEKKMNQSDGIHPNENGHKQLLANIYPSIERLVKSYVHKNKKFEKKL